MSSISVAMIVRDAAATLRNALQSVQGHVDEIVVVDTGSVDDTVSVAREYTDRVHYFPWIDDFAAARQYAHDQCESEWVFCLDSDDQVFQAESLRPLVQHASADMDAYMIRYVLSQEPDGQAGVEFYRERLVRKSRMRWVGRVHEVMIPTQGSCRYERFEETSVLHRGHGDGQRSLERNIHLLRLQLADQPEDTRTMFYLGRDLVSVGRIKEGKRQLQHYMKTATWADEMYIAQTLIAYCFRTEGLYREAYDADIQLLYINPLWPQAYFQLAQDCYYLQQWDRSIHFCEIAQRLNPPVTNLFVSRASLTYEWMIYQVVALHQLGRRQEAAALTDRALQLCPTDHMHQLNKGFFSGLLIAS